MTVNNAMHAWLAVQAWTKNVLSMLCFLFKCVPAAYLFVCVTLRAEVYMVITQHT